MALNINKLLTKKGWTGEEVGRVLMASMIDDIKHQANPDHKPVIAQQDYERMAANLRTQRDAAVLNIYETLHYTLIQLFNKAQLHQQQLFHAFYKYINAQNMLITCTNAARWADCNPLNLTARQYEKIQAAVVDAAKQRQVSFTTVLFECLDYFLSDGAPEHIEAILEKLEEQPATLTDGLMAAYNARHEPDYYTLPDGRSSEDMSAEEWQAAQDDLLMQRYQFIREDADTHQKRPFTLEETKKQAAQDIEDDAVQALFRGVEAVRAMYTQRTGQTLDGYSDGDIMEAWGHALAKRHKELFMQLPATTCADELIDKMENALEIFPLQAHYDYEGFSKVDVLTFCLAFYRGETPHADKKEGLRAFKKDYPALYAALEAYIKESVPVMRDLKPQQYFKECITVEELANMDFANYIGAIYEAEDIHGDSFTAAVWKAVKNRPCPPGVPTFIAILKDYPGEEYNELPAYQNLMDIDALMDGSPLCDVWKELDDCIPLMSGAFKYIMGYNAVAEVLADLFNIAESDVLQNYSIYDFAQRIGNVNENTAKLFAQISGYSEEKHRRQAKFFDLFERIDCNEWKPTQEEKEAMRSDLEEMANSPAAKVKLNVFAVENVIRKYVFGGYSHEE